MSDYSKTTDFSTKDGLPSGNAGKIIKGSEHDTEYDNIATAVATKANKIASATNNNLVTMDANGDIKDSTITTDGAGAITATIIGSADSWTTGRTISLTGDVTGVSAAFDGSGNLSFATSIAGGVIDDVALATGSVHTAELNTSSNEVSTTGRAENLTLGGGSYGFYPRVKMSATTSQQWLATVLSNQEADQTVFQPSGWTSYVTNITLGEVGTDTMFARQEFVNASPPYDLGDGEIAYFVFIKIDNTTGNIESVYSSPTAPWHYNGPTDIRGKFDKKTGKFYQKKKIIPDNIKSLAPHARVNAIKNIEPELIEITQNIKNADMDFISHPFLFNNLIGKTVAMIDPVSNIMLDFKELAETGDSINQIIHDGFLTIGNTQLQRNGPQSILIPSIKWKNTP